MLIQISDTRNRKHKKQWNYFCTSLMYFLKSKTQTMNQFIQSGAKVKRHGVSFLKHIVLYDFCDTLYMKVVRV